MSAWKYVGFCYGDRFEINSLNVWDYKWRPVMRRPGEVSAPPGILMPPPPDSHLRVAVKDPLYGQDHVFHVYEISDGTRKAEFAAGEFSNNVWGFYVRDQS